MDIIKNFGSPQSILSKVKLTFSYNRLQWGLGKGNNDLVCTPHLCQRKFTCGKKDFRLAPSAERWRASIVLTSEAFPVKTWKPVDDIRTMWIRERKAEVLAPLLTLPGGLRLLAWACLTFSLFAPKFMNSLNRLPASTTDVCPSCPGMLTLYIST